MTASQRVRALFLCLAAALLFSQQAGRSQTPPPPDSLKFFKNYFGTIDYVVAGKGLEGQGGSNGLASGSIHMTGAPEGAEALGAFLYWQVVSDTGSDTGAIGVKFDGQTLSSPGPPYTTQSGPLAVVGDPAGTPPCWSSGGGTGMGGSKKTYTYRADVLRFLPVVNGRHQINGDHTLELPDNGNANNAPRALGGSLVVIIRKPDPAAAMNAIVIYDGSHTLNNAVDSMNQTIKGYYDPVAGAPGQITVIAGAGQANKDEYLVALPGVLTQETNPFRSLDGASWDTVTRTTAAPAGPSFLTSVHTQGLGTHDCLTFGAIIYRTPVNDSDGDGLLNIWETSPNLVDPNGEPLPNLSGVANPNRKDIFVELGYFKTTEAQNYPVVSNVGGVVSVSNVSKPEHSHRPTPEALKQVGDTLAAAPVTNPDGSTGISVHFDVGDYLDPAGVADPYIIRGALARGGEWLNETTTVCTRGPSDPPWVCQFPTPGTVGWKSGFRFIRDAPLTLSDDACDAAEHDGNAATHCERRFDQTRKDIFRYVLFTHFLGIPKEDCLVDVPGPNFGFPIETCQLNDPLFHVPVTNTGVGDYLGGDAIVSLGGFDNAAGEPVGTDYIQAATLLHEVGHTVGLRHGGDPLEPNCKPNYLSVMNYLFQLRGLRDNAGVAHLNFSGQSLAAIDERFLSDGGTLVGAQYRTGWYAPQGPGTTGTPATRHCDGSPLLSTDPVMVRVDSSSVEGPIDWNKSPDAPSPLGQDLNFDGTVGLLNPGFNDWAHIRLNQLGTRRNVGGWFWVPDPAHNDYVAFIGPMSLGVGRGDVGLGDMSRDDLGRGDVQTGDMGRGDVNMGDLGRGDVTFGSLGRGDVQLGRGDVQLGVGRGDVGLGDFGRGDVQLGAGGEKGETNKEQAAAGGFSPPNGLTVAIVVGTDGVCAGLTPAQCHRMQLRWTAPDLGLDVLTQFRAFRKPGGGGTPVLVGTVPFVKGQAAYVLIDQQELPNAPFTYYVVADFGPSTTSDESNNVTKTAVNIAPMATGESYSTNYGVPLVVPAPGVLGNDTDVDSPSLTAQVVTPPPPAHGTLALNANGSFTYTPAAGFIGTDQFTYMARDVDPTRGSNVVTVSITVTPIVYGFVNVQNLPPPANKTFKSGSTVGLKWQFTLGGVPVDSTNADVSITITGPNGVSVTFRPQEPGHSEFKPPTAANGWTWQINWQTVVAGGPTDGTALPVGNYTVRVNSGQSGQTFPVPPAVIKLVK